MDAALLVMISTLFVAMLGSSWQQSRENAKTRSLMVQLNDDTRSELRGEMRDLRSELRGDINELRSDHKSLAAALGDVRERLARIEGHLGIGIEKPAETDTESSG
ncbi:MAG: hypothetical protein OXF75_07400 [Acidimicrobiaceae bacterium]|nr:hypothetical protein [Acidimicrobiaceae bacterium]